MIDDRRAEESIDGLNEMTAEAIEQESAQNASSSLARDLPPIEVLVRTFYALSGYVLATAVIGFLRLPGDAIYLVAAGLVGLFVLGRIWRRQAGPRAPYAVAFLLLGVGLIGLDLLTALSDWLF